MRNQGRLFGLVVVFSAGVALVAVLSIERIDTPLPASLAPVFGLLGTPVTALDHLVTRVIPIDAVDEGELGELLSARYEANVDPDDPDYLYVNDLMERLAATQARKPFDYRVYILNWSMPNAMALPGGVILVTTGLLEVVNSEAELAAVLAHELGHIERGHCLDAVKFRILADKLGARPLGQIIDSSVRIMVGHSFSKTQEHDADEFAYAALLDSPYDPAALGMAFGSLLEYQRARGRRSSQGVDPFRDYFRSHPPLEVREAEFRERAGAWWRRHPGEVRQMWDNPRARKIGPQEERWLIPPRTPSLQRLSQPAATR